MTVAKTDLKISRERYTYANLDSKTERTKEISPINLNISDFSKFPRIVKCSEKKKKKIEKRVGSFPKKHSGN